jgi:hypothetical protein
VIPRENHHCHHDHRSPRLDDGGTPSGTDQTLLVGDQSEEEPDFLGCWLDGQHSHHDEEVQGRGLPEALPQHGGHDRKSWGVGFYHSPPPRPIHQSLVV